MLGIITTFVTMKEKAKRYKVTVQTTLSAQTVAWLDELKPTVERPTRSAVLEKAVSELYQRETKNKK